jgi:hypothetical protein
MQNVPRRAQRVTGDDFGRTIAQAADHKAKGNEFFKAEKFNEVSRAEIAHAARMQGAGACQV